MALPFLPGSSDSAQLGKERFHKSQILSISNGFAMLVGLEKPGIGGEPLVGQKITSKYSVYPKGEGRDRPSWVAFDKQVLCFEAYFRETVPNAKVETYRIRKCKIYFFLEDDTIQVVEPKSKNSGLPQGTLIHRHRIPLPPPNNDQFYNVFHFNINQDMVLYSRTFTVTNCDCFTKNFLIKLGVYLNEPAMVPDDPYSIRRQQIEESMNPFRPYERRNTLKQFLDFDGKVLRFHCLWDDTKNIFGDQRELILHYYLADDTIEVFEVIPPNSGREHVSKFLSRSKLPKTGAACEDYYRDSDLTVGGEVNIWGRKVIITDCDEFTKKYYSSKYGIEDFTPVQYKVPPAPKPPQPVPPYNGFGSEEDSLSSCQSLLPKRPQKDLRKFMEKDRYGLNSNMLNFHAKMMTTDPVDRERAFSISFYLSDDSMRVFERPQKNSGLLGGKFLKRQRIRKPGQELFKSEPFEYFTAQDLYVGAIVCLNGVNFQLLDADNYTLNYMEQHAEEFPRANTANIFSKLRSIPEGKQSEIRKFLSLSDPSNTGFIPYESFRGLMMGLDCGLTEHEVLVLARCFSQRQQPEVDVGLMLAVAQDFLRRKHFVNFPHLANIFMYNDRQKVGCLPTKEVRTICKAFPLPLPDSLQEGLLNRFADGDGIDYHAFVAGINWLEHPAPPVMPDDILKVSTRFDDGCSALKNINYSNLLKDIFNLSPNAGDPETAASM
ncbi:EF-hand domain-containing family member C2 isoform 2-T2 [Anableps anableps]